ncbi:MAG: secretin N-terminal domain-containing protein [Verrucomicrobiota bacterium]
MDKITSFLLVGMVLGVETLRAEIVPARPTVVVATPAVIAPPTGVGEGSKVDHPGMVPPPIDPARLPGQKAESTGPAVIPPPIEQRAIPGLDPAIPASIPPPVPPNGVRTLEFQGEEIGLVLRTLARQAKINIVISDKVTVAGNTVTMRIEDKTPKEAIETLIISKGLIMDEQKGVYFIKTAEEKKAEPTESDSYTFSYATAEKTVDLLKGQLQSGVVPQADPRTNTIYYRESRSNLAKIQLFLASVDRPTKQVMIEARLVEVTANPNQSYGINWAGVVGGASTPQTVRYGGSTLTTPDAAAAAKVGPLGNLQGQDFLMNGATRGAFGDALAGQFAILSVPAMSVTMRLLNEDADAEFLAHPRVVTANNLEAKIEITRAQPIPTLNFNEQTAQAVFSGFQDKEFGNKLKVTPSINKDGYISMSVKPEISNKVGDAVFVFGGATVTSPIIDKRSLDSNVLIHSGETLAIGGLLQDEQLKRQNKVPFLGDVPLLGYFFQEKLNTRSKRNLLIFVTPTIIEQGYGTGLEDQVTGLTHSGEEYADPNGWRNNAKGAKRIVPTSNRPLVKDYAKPGVAPAPRKIKVSGNGY